MTTQVGLSFDDSLMDQFKWAHTMHELSLRGVFYISPLRLGWKPRPRQPGTQQDANPNDPPPRV